MIMNKSESDDELEITADTLPYGGFLIYHPNTEEEDGLWIMADDPADLEEWQ